MKIEKIKENCRKQIKGLKNAAASGQEVSAGVAIENQMLIDKFDKVVSQITDEEWQRITAGVHGIKRDMRDCKDIKEKYDLSWKELEMLRNSGIIDEPLKVIRREKGLTQKQLAEESGVNQRTIENYECGKTDLKKASIETGIALAKALDCRVEDLI